MKNCFDHIFIIRNQTGQEAWLYYKPHAPNLIREMSKFQQPSQSLPQTLDQVFKPEDHSGLFYSQTIQVESHYSIDYIYHIMKGVGHLITCLFRELSALHLSSFLIDFS